VYKDVKALFGNTFRNSITVSGGKNNSSHKNFEILTAFPYKRVYFDQILCYQEIRVIN